MQTETANRSSDWSASRLWPWTIGIFLVVAALLSRTVDDLGVTWDEPVYRYTQTQMADWFKQLTQCRSFNDLSVVFSRDALHQHWIGGRYGKNFHPPMAALLNNVSLALLGGWIDDMAARRMASALQLAAVAAMLLVFVGRRYGRAAGAVAAGALCLVPRVFGHANLGGTDMPMLFFWAALALLGCKAVEGRRRWQVAFAVVLGMGFLVKLPVVLVLLPSAIWLAFDRPHRPGSHRRLRGDLTWCIVLSLPLLITAVEVRRLAGAMWDSAEAWELEQQNMWSQGRIARPPAKEDRWGYMSEQYLRQPKVGAAVPACLLFVPLGLWVTRACVRAKRSGAPLASPRVELALACLAFAPAVVVALHPGWWRETLVRLGHYYLLCTARRGALPDIEIFYLGRKYLYSLPWHNGFVLPAVTVPLGILALGLAGAVIAWLRLRRDRFPLLLLLNLLTLPLVRMFPTPAHDGVRLMLPAFFFLAALAGIGFAGVCNRAQQWIHQWRATATIVWLRPAVAAAALAPAALGLLRAHPFELSYYNAAVGGLPGAMRAGLEVSYWYDALNPAAAGRFNDLLATGAAPVLPEHAVSASAAVEMSLTGRLPLDTPPAADAPKFLLLLTHSSKSHPTYRLIYAMRPALVLARHRGVRLISVYDRQAMDRARALTLLAGSLGPLESHLRLQIEQLRAENPRAVSEAEQILAQRQRDVRRIINYQGYLTDATLGTYLDSGLAKPQQ